MNYAFNFELMQQMKELATQRGLPVEYLIEEAMHYFVDSQVLRVLEKQLPDGTYRVVTIHPYGICMEHVSKRINLDSFKDIALLLEDGYYPISQ